MKNNVFVSQSKSQGVKETYIEYVRAAATLAVVFLHTVVTLPANYTPAELGINNTIVFNSFYMTTKWAVPCFIMITGSLLLNPEREVNTPKIFQYIKRMFLVLLIFGTGYALLEIVYTEKELSIAIFFEAVLNTLEGNSWDHLWYIYTLISLYVITIPLRYVTKYMDEKTMNILICILIVGNFIIPSINALFGIELRNYMILNEYTTYYLLGYWYFKKKNDLGKMILLPGILATGIMVASEIFSLKTVGEPLAINHQTGEILTLIQSISVFLFIRQICLEKEMKIGKGCSVIAKYSFAIYLVHPFFINLFYKLLNITPLSFPIGLGIAIIYTMVLVLSFIVAIILKKIPILKNII